MTVLHAHGRLFLAFLLLVCALGTINVIALSPRFNLNETPIFSLPKIMQISLTHSVCADFAFGESPDCFYSSCHAPITV